MAIRNKRIIYGVQPSNLDAIFNQLIELINAGDALEFKRLLQSDFILSAEGASFNHVPARPNIEQLLFADITKFEQLIDAIMMKNDPQWYDAFKAALMNTDLENSDLFVWNNDIKNKTVSELQNVVRYGDLLKKDSRPQVREKGELAVSLGDELLSNIRNRDVASSKTDEDKFNFLKSKIQIIRTLHQHDSAFNMHRGWKRFIANLSSILLSQSTASGSKTKMSESALFFSQNQTCHKTNIEKTSLAEPRP